MGGGGVQGGDIINRGDEHVRKGDGYEGGERRGCEEVL